jgi:hypothetical protein
MEVPSPVCTTAVGNSHATIALLVILVTVIRELGKQQEQQQEQQRQNARWDREEQEPRSKGNSALAHSNEPVTEGSRR